MFVLLRTSRNFSPSCHNWHLDFVNLRNAMTRSWKVRKFFDFQIPGILLNKNKKENTSLNAVGNAKKRALSSLRNSAARPAFMSSKRNASELYRRAGCKTPVTGLSRGWRRNGNAARDSDSRDREVILDKWSNKVASSPAARAAKKAGDAVRELWCNGAFAERNKQVQ